MISTYLDSYLKNRNRKKIAFFYNYVRTETNLKQN